MVQGRFISEADYQTLQRILRWWRRQEPRRTSIEPDEALDQTPDVYIALPPVYGIPGITRSGTSGGPEEGDIPGTAECDIYLMNTDGSFYSTGLTKTVYNFREDAIAYDWITIERSKQGYWYAVGVVETQIGTGTGCPSIPGVNYDDLDIVSAISGVDYVLGINDNCLVLVPVSECTGT